MRSSRHNVATFAKDHQSLFPVVISDLLCLTEHLFIGEAEHRLLSEVRKLADSEGLLPFVRKSITRNPLS